MQVLFREIKIMPCQGKNELQAIVIAAIMKIKIVEEIQLGINQVFMWSALKLSLTLQRMSMQDSTYIYNTSNQRNKKSY